jgi:glucose-1-phosphate adenylyltransferase
MVILANPRRVSSSSVKPIAQPHAYPLDMKRVAAIILGGGQGTRLFPLTMWRCKPVTQLLSSSLHQHVFKTYRLDAFSSGFIELLPAEEKPKNNKSWFQGTADAVRQNLDYFIETPVDYFFILSGDQLYNMDFQQMMIFAKEIDADLVVAALPVNENDAKRMGILQVNEDNIVKGFVEKPQEKETLDKMRLSSYQEQKFGIDPAKKLNHLGSMGIYLFKRNALLDLLQLDPREDFGKHLIPTKVAEGSVAAYIYQGYWEDIGTIESFYNANMALTRPTPLFDCYDEARQIFSSPTNLPGARVFNTQMNCSIICEGSIVEADEVSHSILGPRTLVNKGAIIRDSYIMGNDFFLPPITTTRLPEKFQIGEDCIIRNAIIDKHVYIGKGVQLINKNKVMNLDGDNVFIRDGIIVVSRGATIPDGFVL